MRALFVLLLVLFLAPFATAQRFNLDTGWIPSVEYTNTPADCAADSPVVTTCAPQGCTLTRVAPVLEYRYTVTVRNLTSEWHTTSGSWLTYWWLFNSAGQPAGNCLGAQGCGVPEFFALLAPNDGLPGGLDEATFVVTHTFTPADGVTTWDFASALFGANARNGTAHRLFVRPTHWWSITVDGAGLAPGGHWPIAFDLTTAEARMRAVVTHF